MNLEFKAPGLKPATIAFISRLASIAKAGTGSVPFSDLLSLLGPMVPADIAKQIGNYGSLVFTGSRFAVDGKPFELDTSPKIKVGNRLAGMCAIQNVNRVATLSLDKGASIEVDVQIVFPVRAHVTSVVLTEDFIKIQTDKPFGAKITF